MGSPKSECRISNVGYSDPKPGRIGFGEWLELFERVPDDLIERYHYYGDSEAWSKYLFPPQTFAIYGARHLRRLKFDNSLAALRMWGFVQNETERLFRARQTGRRVIATMGDLGAVPVIVNSFPGCVAFYPDCIWWTPFVMESRVLFDAAAESTSTSIRTWSLPRPARHATTTPAWSNWPSSSSGR